MYSESFIAKFHNTSDQEKKTSMHLTQYRPYTGKEHAELGNLSKEKLVNIYKLNIERSCMYNQKNRITDIRNTSV